MSVQTDRGLLPLKTVAAREHPWDCPRTRQDFNGFIDQSSIHDGSPPPSGSVKIERRTWPRFRGSTHGCVPRGVPQSSCKSPGQRRCRYTPFGCADCWNMTKILLSILRVYPNAVVLHPEEPLTIFALNPDMDFWRLISAELRWRYRMRFWKSCISCVSSAITSGRDVMGHRGTTAGLVFAISVIWCAPGPSEFLRSRPRSNGLSARWLTTTNTPTGR